MKRKNKLILGAALLVLPTVIYATVTQVDDLAVGNVANSPSSNSAVVGINNHASYTSMSVGVSGWTHEYSLVAGHSNRAKNMSVALGWQNDVNYAASGQYPRHALASGLLNDVLGNSSFATGYNNDVTADNCSVLGKGLVSTTDNATTVGQYNENKAGVLFVVGKGTSGSARSNALEIHDDGSVIINQSQGDIDMGSFGN